MMLLSALLLSEHSFWWLIPIAIIALGLSLWLYKSKWTETPRAILILMFSLRFLTLFLIGVLLLKPLLNHPHTELYKAQLLIVQDQSQSLLLHKDSTAYTQDYNHKMQAFKAELEAADIPYQSYGFSDSLFSNEDIRFDQSVTDISTALRHVSDFNSNEHVGGILLLSDGIHNKGEDPYFSSKNLQTPVFTIGLGDTSSYSDLKIENVNMNKVAYSKRTIPFNVDIKAMQLSGKTQKLSIYENETLLFESAFTVDKDLYYRNIEQILPPLEPGLHLLTFQLSQDDSEQNTKNNSYRISLNVIDAKKKILILSAAPHPDIAALKTALQWSQSYELTHENHKEFKGKFEDFDLVILHQLPSLDNNPSLNTTIKESQTALLYMVSPQSNIRLLDEQIENIKISKAIKKNEWLQAAHHSNFKLFSLDEEIQEFMAQAPPLIAPILKTQSMGQLDVLAFQKIKSIATERPLICFTENDAQKKGFIFGEGIWKWKMYDFQANGSFSNFSQLMEKMVQYLCLEAPKSNFMVDIKNQYSDNEPILIKAQFYNQSMELDLEQELSFEYTNQAGETLAKPMSIHQNQYQTQLSYLNEGIYQYRIIKAGEQAGVQDKILNEGAFSVLASQLEYLNTTARHDLLQKISEQTQAKFHTEADWFSVIQDIQNHPKFITKSFTNYQLESWINFRWILLIIAVLISTEWFLRKYFGSI